MVASRILARVSRQCIAAVRRPGALRFGAAGAEPFAGSCSSIRVSHMNQHLGYSTSIFRRFRFSSSSPEQSDKEVNQPEDPESTSHGSNGASLNEDANSSGSKKASEPGAEDLDLSKDDRMNLLREKDELLKSKDDKMNDTKDKVLCSYAEMENVIARTKRDSDSSKKYAVQNFSKNLLDVADNLARASSVVK